MMTMMTKPGSGETPWREALDDDDHDEHIDVGAYVDVDVRSHRHDIVQWRPGLSAFVNWLVEFQGHVMIDLRPIKLQR